MGRDALPSIRFFSRARTSSQRGFALVAAIVLAILYFALIELLMMDASRELAEARRFRSKIVAATLAENGAELAAAGIVGRDHASVSAEDWQGKIEGEMTKTGGVQFQIVGRATTKGLSPVSATVNIQGRILGNELRIQYTQHSQ